MLSRFSVLIRRFYNHLTSYVSQEFGILSENNSRAMASFSQVPGNLLNIKQRQAQVSDENKSKINFHFYRSSPAQPILICGLLKQSKISTAIISSKIKSFSTVFSATFNVIWHFGSLYGSKVNKHWISRLSKLLEIPRFTCNVTSHV